MPLAARSGLTVFALVLGIGWTGSVTAQTHVGRNVEGGMHWHVAAPEGASWRLECRFPPVTYERNAYDRHAWMNKITVRGEGPDAGRLPLNVGQCRLWKTGGTGPVGLALSRPGETAADGTRDPNRPAAVGFL